MMIMRYYGDDRGDMNGNQMNFWEMNNLSRKILKNFKKIPNSKKFKKK